MKIWVLRAVLIVCCTFFGISHTVWAAPTITEPFLYVLHTSPNPLGIPEGLVLALGCSIADPLGVPGNIMTAKAIALDGQPDYDLEFLNLAIVAGLYQYPLVGQPPYSGQTGRWNIVVENAQGDTASVETHNLDKIHTIPLAQNISISDNSLTPLITWDPVLYDHDNNGQTAEIPVDNYRIRFVSPGGFQFYRSDSFTNPSFQVPSGILSLGTPVYVRIEARQIDPADNAVENRSDTFTTSPFTPSSSNKVPIFNGWWFLPAALAGFVLLRRIRD